MNLSQSRHHEAGVADRAVKHRHLELDGIGIFYREAGAKGAPAVLLPHGYPCSSYQFRQLMPALADRWHLVAPDFPGFGYSDTPDGFAYDFDGYADFLAKFTEALKLDRFAIYLHDYGSQIGLRLAIRAPERIAALIIQNGDIYEDELGPKYDALKEYFANPTPAGRHTLMEAISEAGFRDEFLNDVRDDLARRIPPDLWKLSWPQMATPKRRACLSARFADGGAQTPRRRAVGARDQHLRDRRAHARLPWPGAPLARKGEPGASKRSAPRSPAFGADARGPSWPTRTRPTTMRSASCR